jgi:hypothetical protein
MQSSFNYRGGSSVNQHFRIKYKLKAKILDESNGVYPMISKKNIMISRPCVNPRQNITMNVSGGSAKVTATFNQDSFNVGETAIIECLVDNTNSSKSIKSLKIKFRRLLKGAVSKRTHNDLDETIIERESFVACLKDNLESSKWIVRSTLPKTQKDS